MRHFSWSTFATVAGYFYFHTDAERLPGIASSENANVRENMYVDG
jgi:hypothetical protein